MTLSSSKLWITFAFPGQHCHDKVPTLVPYQRDVHRHLFKFRVAISLRLNDGLNAHEVLLVVTSWYTRKELALDYLTVRQIALDLLRKLEAAYPGGRTFEVDISEDGECGETHISEPD